MGVCRQGRPSPEAFFLPCFRFPPSFRKIFRLCGNFSKFLPFPEKLLDFHPPKFLMTLFPPIFHISVHFPPVSRKLSFPPTLKNFPACFRKIHLFLHTLCVFCFPP